MRTTIRDCHSRIVDLSTGLTEPLAGRDVQVAVPLAVLDALGMDEAALERDELRVRRAHAAHLPPEHTQHYLSLATLIVESAALYSAFAIAFLVSYALDAPINQIWLGFAQAAQVRGVFRFLSQC